MQYLDVAGRLFPDVLSGVKTNTMRWHETRIVPGSLMLINCDDRTQTHLVQVTRCTDVALSQAAAWVGIEKEWPADKMLASMRSHYPEITLSDSVQVIEFEHLI